MKRRMMVVTLGVLVVACSGPAMEVAGDAMVAAGDALRDVGGANVADARADVVSFDVPCEAVSGTRIVTTATGRTSTTLTLWTATIRDPSLTAARVRRVDVSICGFVQASETVPPVDPMPDCPSGSTCSGSLPTIAPQLDCVSTGAQFADGVAYVYCGQDQSAEVFDSSGAMTRRARVESHRTRARFSIDTQ